MGKKRKEQAQILSQKEIAPGIYDMWLLTDMGKEAGAGQFVGVYPKDGARLLPRPISICQAEKTYQGTTRGALRLVYRVAGEGTKEFSSWQQGESVSVLGVLGNGFPIQEAKNKKVLLMGGGIGIPPMVELAKELSGQGCSPVIIAGYRDKHLFLDRELSEYGALYIATEDGSAGTKGNVLTVLKEHEIEGDMIMGCGPVPMLRAIREYSREKGIRAYISLEERMACGVGACLGCVCRTVHKNSHSHVNNARICTEGPVFEAQEVDI